MASLLRSLIPNVPTVAPVPHRAILSVAGTQAAEFLNGILASTVQEPARPLYSALLHPQGRILYDVFLYTKTDSLTGQRSYLLEYDSRPSDATPMLSLLKRYVLRSKVSIRDVSEEYDIWAAWGSSKDARWETTRQWNWTPSGVIEPKWDFSEWPWGINDESILDRRATYMGRRFLVKKGDRPREMSDHDVASSEAYTLHRILRGVPEGQIDMPAMQAFPMDSNLDAMGGLNFRKGCYVGQELTVRTYHTGVIRKRILPVVIQSPEQTFPSNMDDPSSPAAVVTPRPDAPSYPTNLDIHASANRGPDDRPVPRPRGHGKLLTSYQGVGLALMRLEHVEGLEKGDFRLEFNASRGDSTETWKVSHWWPDWWPRKTE